MSDQPVLVPVAVLEGESVPDAVVELLATLPVVVLGYHVLPEQTAPGQARLQFEERAQATLDDLAAAFRAAGGDADTRLVFTHDEQQTLERVAAETGCVATLLPNPTGPVERLLVAVDSPADADRTVDFVAALVGGRPIDVTVLAVVDEADEAGAAGERAAAEEVTAGLGDRGVGATTAVATGAAVEAITAAADDHDAVVMGESAPSLRTLLFGEAAERVAARSLGPVVLVHEPDPDTDRG